MSNPSPKESKTTDSKINLLPIHKQIIQHLSLLESNQTPRKESSSGAPSFPQKRVFSNISKFSVEHDTEQQRLEQKEKETQERQFKEFQSLKEQLQKLQTRKIFLKAELQREQCELELESSTIGNGLLHTLSLNSNLKQHQPYLHDYDNIQRDWMSSAVVSSSALNETNLATSLAEVRKRRKLVAAHRLSGISCIPFHETDENVIAIKMEISIHGGQFIASHHLFFQILKTVQESINKDEPKSPDNRKKKEQSSPIKRQYYEIRLVQHTLPYSINIRDIIKRNSHSNGPKITLPLQNKEVYDVKKLKHNHKKPTNEANEPHEAIHATDSQSQLSPDTPAHLMHSLRDCLGEMYDAAFSYALRTHSCRQLESIIQDMRKTSNQATLQKIQIQSIQHNDAHDECSIQLFSSHIATLTKAHRRKGLGRTIKISLTYTNPLVCIPTHVTVKYTNEYNSSHTLETVNGVIGSAIDWDDEEIDVKKHNGIKSIATLFRVLDITHATKRAVKVIRKDMLE